MRFNGSDYDQERDAPRLSNQYKRVFELMQDGEWRALREIADLTGDPEASVSAQLRHMRKERFESHVIEKKYIENGLYHYRLLVNKGDCDDTERTGRLPSQPNGGVLREVFGTQDVVGQEDPPRAGGDSEQLVFDL